MNAATVLQTESRAVAGVEYQCSPRGGEIEKPSSCIRCVDTSTGVRADVELHALMSTSAKSKGRPARGRRASLVTEWVMGPIR